MDDETQYVISFGLLAAFAIWWVMFRTSSKDLAPPPTNLTQQPPLTPTFVDPPVAAIPIVGTLYRTLKPLEKPIQNGLAKVNTAIGGVNPYGNLTPNGDGTYTDGAKCKITPNKDGSYNRDCGAWDKNIKPVEKVAKKVASGAVSVAKKLIPGW